MNRFQFNWEKWYNNNNKKNKTDFEQSKRGCYVWGTLEGKQTK